MPNPNSLDYTQRAVKIRIFLDIYDEQQNFISSVENVLVVPKEQVSFQITTADGVTAINVIFNDAVIWSISNNPDAINNTNNSDFKGINDLSQIADDIFNNFYNY